MCLFVLENNPIILPSGDAEPKTLDEARRQIKKIRLNVESLKEENVKLKKDGAIKEDLIKKLRERLPPVKSKTHQQNEGWQSTKKFEELSKFLSYLLYN